MSYDISISEQQRRVLETVLQHFCPSDAVPKFDGTDTDEAVVLMTLLSALPASEAESPGVLHGFCL